VPASNPLLDALPLPAFDRILPEHAVPAITKIIEENQALLETLCSALATEAELLVPLEQAEAHLHEAFSPVRHLRAVLNTPQWREAYNACLEKITEYETYLAQNKGIYAKFVELDQSDLGASLSTERQAELRHALQAFRLGGVALAEKEKAEFAQIQQTLAATCAKFTDNVTDSTQAWSLSITDESRLEGLPERVRALLQDDARAHGESGWRINLTPPCVQAVLSHAQDRELRREVYTAHATRASDQGPHDPTHDNTETIEQILELRHKAARLLGYDNITEHQLETRMAKNPQEVLDFLGDLRDRAKQTAKNELESLRKFAQNEYGLEPIQRWDLAWVSERLRERELNLSDEEVAPYFAADPTIQGMVDLVSELFGLQIVRREDAAVWHSDVRFYEIRDSGGDLRGQFYLDPYARSDKHGGAWMDVCMQRRQRDAEIQPGVAYLTCNGMPPAGEVPSLFTHADVVTLFHEFGHGLHHMLTRVNCASVSGIEGVEWDAVEWPSQWMENWCWEPQVLQRFARHYQTGEVIPHALTERLRESRRFLAGLALMRQLEFALFDFRLHLEYQPGQGARVEELLSDIRAEIDLLDTPSFVRTAQAFEHIFSGGYTAGYYSYKWAEVLSGDSFEAFEEEGLFNPEVAQRFEKCLLSAGGVRPAAEMFAAFRGREPQSDALLRQMGLAA